MSANAFAISRRLVAKGVEKTVADAVAEEIVTHADETAASKADVARLEGKMDSRISRVEEKINVLIALVITLVGGLWVGAGVYFLVNSLGSG